MGPLLNRYIPVYSIVRWWYVLAAGSAGGLTFSLITRMKPLSPRHENLFIAEGPPSHINVASFTLYQMHGWKENLLFAVLGFLLACGLIWLREELRAYQHQFRER